MWTHFILGHFISSYLFRLSWWCTQSELSPTAPGWRLSWSAAAKVPHPPLLIPRHYTGQKLQPSWLHSLSSFPAKFKERTALLLAQPQPSYGIQVKKWDKTRAHNRAWPADQVWTYQSREFCGNHSLGHSCRLQRQQARQVLHECFEEDRWHWGLHGIVQRWKRLPTWIFWGVQHETSLCRIAKGMQMCSLVSKGLPTGKYCSSKE